MSRNKLIEETLKNAKKARDLAQAKDPAKIKEDELLEVLRKYAEDARGEIPAGQNSQVILTKIETAEKSILLLEDVLNEAKTKEAESVKQAKDVADKALEAAQERVNTAIKIQNNQLDSANTVLDLIKILTTVDEIIKKLEQEKFNKSANAITDAKTNNPKITLDEAIKILEDRKGTAKTKFDNAKTAAELTHKIADLTQAVNKATEPFDQLSKNTYVYNSSKYTTAEGALTTAQAEFKKLCNDNSLVLKSEFYQSLYDTAASQGIDAVVSRLDGECLVPHTQCSYEEELIFNGVNYSCCVVD